MSSSFRPRKRSVHSKKKYPSHFSPAQVAYFRRGTRKPDCHPDRRYSGRGLCRTCYARVISNPKQAENKAQWAKNNRDRTTLSSRKHLLEKKYGISLGIYDLLCEVQNNLCAICGRRPPQLHVDHCHRTGAVRGLLCGPCNRGLGQLGDDPVRLIEALQYLAMFQQRLRDHKRL